MNPPPKKLKYVAFQSKRKKEDPLPLPFELPANFTPNVTDGLQQKMLFGKTHAKFITTVAQTIYRFKSYPTEEEYEHVVQQILKQWPFLDNNRDW